MGSRRGRVCVEHIRCQNLENDTFGLVLDFVGLNMIESLVYVWDTLSGVRSVVQKNRGKCIKLYLYRHQYSSKHAQLCEYRCFHWATLSTNLPTDKTTHFRTLGVFWNHVQQPYVITLCFNSCLYFFYYIYIDIYSCFCSTFPHRHWYTPLENRRKKAMHKTISTLTRKALPLPSFKPEPEVDNPLETYEQWSKLCIIMYHKKGNGHPMANRDL